MSTAAREDRPLAAPTASAVWPVLFLAAVAGVCWAVTVERMQGMDMGLGTDLGGVGWFAGVWVTMMTAMMLPSLSPMAVASSRAAGAGQARSIAGTVVFAAGYLLPFAAFGVLAYVRGHPGVRQSCRRTTLPSDWRPKPGLNAISHAWPSRSRKTPAYPP
jgi:hypothetical protein